MKRYAITVLMAVTLAFGCCAALNAGPLLPGDSLTIQLKPSDGLVIGAPGSFVGWGFVVDWASVDNHWLQFTTAGISEESNQSVADGPLIPFITTFGGPDHVHFGLSPTYGKWEEDFNYAARTGIGAYHITSDPASHLADDRGRIALAYEVFSGPPDTAESLGGGTYYVDFTVSVGNFALDAVPEPGTLGLLFAGCGLMLIAAWRR